MRVVPSIVWRCEGEGGEPLDARLLPLLQAIAASASLAAAVTACGISYRAAWGLLRAYETRLRTPLVVLERGRGARLTPAGERLLQAQEAASQRLARILPLLATEVGPASTPAPHGKPPRLRVAASHDLALAALAQTLPGDAGLELDLTVMGSLLALREFAEGRADVAGFHVPVDARTFPDRSAFARWLRPRTDRLIQFVDRVQGLILPRGNPAVVRNLRDVAARKLRFVNRQRGSGTRLLLDGLIDAARIDAHAIAGYGNEEFTHGAVAATVASGGADAGFGLRAAAAEYRLAFVPLARERYFFAARARDLNKPALARLLAALRDPSFTRLARRLPGYDLSAAGAVTTVDAINAAPAGRGIAS